MKIKLIATGVKREMPNASGVSASIPLTDIASNITSDSIKLANSVLCGR